ncbi:hypothetical protein [Sporolactobacillus vineae]|uniref:hypothetical protein n=1 Tax=Sporolactobacillus vineae TaxID=444463 RepID=UPI001146E8B7|nr:hypothetical protein [Sporolactobacillus vineae]
MKKDHQEVLKQDTFLSSLVMLANSGMETGITLNVSGTVISGMLISGETYFKELAAQFASLPQTEFIETLIRTLNTNADRFKKSIEADRKNQTIRPPHYLHLRDCCFLNTDRKNSTQRQLWRGLLTSVDGFSVGVAETDR